MKILTIKKTTHNGYQVVLKQDVDTDYESILEVEFFDTKRKVKNFVSKLNKIYDRGDMLLSVESFEVVATLNEGE